VFVPTLGGAAVTDDPELDRAAFRIRAVENFVYLVVAKRGGGSMIVSPHGKILAEAQGGDSLAIAEIDPHDGRDGGDSANHQRDMRARLFRRWTPAPRYGQGCPKPPHLPRRRAFSRGCSRWARNGSAMPRPWRARARPPL